MSKQSQLSKKQDLLESSYEIFAKEGFHGISMRKLSSQLGVTTGTLYHYFPSKEDLFTELVKYHVNKDVETVQSLVASEQELWQLMEIIFSYVKQRQDYFKLMILLVLEFKRSDNQPNSAKIEAVHEAISSGFQHYQIAIQEILGLPNTSASKVVMSLIIGTIIQSVLVDEPSNLTDILSLMATLKGGTL